MGRGRFVFISAFLAGALACGALALTTSRDPAARGVERATTASAGWSPLRVPQPFVDAVGAVRLQDALARAIAHEGTGCFAVSTSAGSVATSAATGSFIGASAQKLLTAAAALVVLGADTTLPTRVVAVGADDAGRVERLVLVGGGDPLLSTTEFRTALASDRTTAGTPATALEVLADRVVAQGVRRVDALVVDDSRYDVERYRPMWPSRYREEGQVGPIGALTVNRGFSELRPRLVATDDPALFAGSELARLLETRGVAVAGAPRRGKAAKDATEVARVESPPIRELVAEIVRSSDNLATEMLVKEIGVRVSGQGTTSAGLEAIARRLAALGVPMRGVDIVDGSGLARENRVTCEALARTVDLGARPKLSALWDGLAVAGVSGTLADELLGTGLEGRLRAKTGFLNGVTALVGIIDVGRPLRFALIVNGGFGETDAVRIRAEVAQILARFPEAPGPDELVPAPLGHTPVTSGP